MIIEMRTYTLRPGTLVEVEKRFASFAGPASAVPEPASFVYLLTGLAGAAGAIRRRFKS